MTGDECLFCHRNDIGPGWSANRHAMTIRRASVDTPAVAALVKSSALKQVAGEAGLFLLGSRKQVRFLKPNGYGRLSLLKEAWVPVGEAERKQEQHGEITPTDKPHWDENIFGKSCAGCHTTGVDSETLRFSDASLDCYVCHGEVTLDHTNDGKKTPNRSMLGIPLPSPRPIDLMLPREGPLTNAG